MGRSVVATMNRICSKVERRGWCRICRLKQLIRKQGSGDFTLLLGCVGYAWRRRCEDPYDEGADGDVIRKRGKSEWADGANPGVGRRVQADWHRGFGSAGDHSSGSRTLQRRNKRHDLAALERGHPRVRGAGDSGRPAAAHEWRGRHSIGKDAGVCRGIAEAIPDAGAFVG